MEEEEKKREEEGVMKEQLKYVHMEKRKKYGELVSQLFQQHNKTLITEIKPGFMGIFMITILPFITLG